MRLLTKQTNKHKCGGGDGTRIFHSFFFFLFIPIKSIEPVFRMCACVCVCVRISVLILLVFLQAFFFVAHHHHRPTLSLAGSKNNYVLNSFSVPGSTLAPFIGLWPAWEMEICISGANMWLQLVEFRWLELSGSSIAKQCFQYSMNGECLKSFFYKFTKLRQKSLNKIKI